MFKPYLVPLILISALADRAHAFDPFTVITVANSVSGLINSTKNVADTVGDLSGFAEFLGLASETLDESTGLAGDLGYESDTNELNSKVLRLEKLNSDLQTLKWGHDDLKYTLDSDINNTRSFASKIHQMRKIINISKKLAGVFGLKTKGSDKVAVLQQVKINSMMLDELQAMRKMQLLGYLEDKERTASQDIYLNKIVVEETKKHRSMRQSL